MFFHDLIQAIKGEKGALNSSTETAPSSEVDQNMEESSDNKQMPQAIQFQVAGKYADTSFFHP